jgi:type VI secretion system protein ImpK
MRPEVLKIVYPILNYGLRLKERRERGEEPDLETEQTTLKGLLNADEGRRFPEYWGDPDAARMGSPDAFLGIRYALACWLDEVLIDGQTRWGIEWDNKKLEQSLFMTQLRAVQVPLQARKAETQKGSDALEAFMLCVMLGFRGEWQLRLPELQDWVNANQARIAKNTKDQWPAPAALPEPPTFVPPLRGWERYQKMRRAGSFVLLVSLLALVVLAIVWQR